MKWLALFALAVVFFIQPAEAQLCMPPICGNGTCDYLYAPCIENPTSCPPDCAGGGICGNLNCEAGENCNNCAVDCGACPPCDGDLICDDDENRGTCADCLPCGPGCPMGQYCWGGTKPCGDPANNCACRPNQAKGGNYTLGGGFTPVGVFTSGDCDSAAGSCFNMSFQFPFSGWCYTNKSIINKTGPPLLFNESICYDSNYLECNTTNACDEFMNHSCFADISGLSWFSGPGGAASASEGQVCGAVCKRCNGTGTYNEGFAPGCGNNAAAGANKYGECSGCQNCSGAGACSNFDANCPGTDNQCFCSSTCQSCAVNKICSESKQCTDPLPNGQPCSRDGQCSTKYCSRGAATSQAHCCYKETTVPIHTTNSPICDGSTNCNYEVNISGTGPACCGGDSDCTGYSYCYSGSFDGAGANQPLGYFQCLNCSLARDGLCQSSKCAIRGASDNENDPDCCSSTANCTATGWYSGFCDNGSCKLCSTEKDGVCASSDCLGVDPDCCSGADCSGGQYCDTAVSPFTCREDLSVFCSADSDCGAGEYCSASAKLCVKSCFVQIKPNSLSSKIGDREPLTAVISDPVGKSRVFRLSLQGSGKFYAHFVGDKSTIDVTVPQGANVSIPLTFSSGVTSYGGPFTLRVVAVDSVYGDSNGINSEPPNCPVPSTSYITVLSQQKSLFFVSAPGPGLLAFAVLAAVAAILLLKRF